MLAELKEGTIVRGCLGNAKKLKTVDDWERTNKCSNIDKMSCLYLNARSVINKMDELELYIIENKPSIIGVTES